jgi:hypothetical protein
MELWSVVEGGIKKEPPPGGVLADGPKYARSSYFNINARSSYFNINFGVLELVRYIIWYSTKERGIAKKQRTQKVHV